MDGASYNLNVYIIMSLILMSFNQSSSCCSYQIILAMRPYVLHSSVRVFHCHTSFAHISPDQIPYRMPTVRIQALLVNTSLGCISALQWLSQILAFLVMSGCSSCSMLTTMQQGQQSVLQVPFIKPQVNRLDATSGARFCAQTLGPVCRPTQTNPCYSHACRFGHHGLALVSSSRMVVIDRCTCAAKLQSVIETTCSATGLIDTASTMAPTMATGLNFAALCLWREIRILPYLVLLLGIVFALPDLLYVEFAF